MIAAQDLMIGDIVDVHRSECVADGGHYMEWNEYGKVVSITEDYITIKYNGREDDYGFEDVEEKDIEPIALTAEILKKNGFGYVEKDVNQYEDKVLSHFYLGDECFCANMDLHIGTYNDRVFWFSSPKVSLNGIRYLHELQHALRLAGIDKEIKL